MEIGKLILTDDELNVITKGAWVGDFKDMPGVELKVTGFSRNQAVQTEIRKRMEAVQENENRNEELTSEQRDAIVRSVLADMVLQDWKGFKDNGKPFKYNAKQARDWITSPNGTALAGLVLEAARQVDERAADFVEGVTKN